MSRVETIGDATLYLALNAEVLPRLDRSASVVSDPPYGMDWDTDSTRFTGGQHKRGEGREDWGDIHGDSEPFDPSPWLEFHSTVLWGANHYWQRLPVGRTLLWLKKPTHLLGTFLSDFEVGWASGGHPTQKPISLMEWCITEFARGAQPVVDPFMGSGTTGVAAARLGRTFIGVEKSSAHFDTACRRIEEAYRQPRLFDEPPPKPVQPSLLDGEAA